MIEIIKPTDPQSENLPPTHSGIERILSEDIPNSFGALVLLETAIKWSFINSSFEFSINHFLIFFAFSSVSIVVNVFETIMKIVVSGFNFSSNFDVKSGSMLETK